MPAALTGRDTVASVPFVPFPFRVWESHVEKVEEEGVEVQNLRGPQKLSNQHKYFSAVTYKNQINAKVFEQNIKFKVRLKLI